MFSLPDILLPKVRHFGLSIERSAIRVVEIPASGKRYKSAEVLLAPDCFSQGVLVKPDELIRAIQQVLNTAGITLPFVSVTFPEMFAYTRQLTLPKLDRAELDEAVNWRIKDLFPLPVDEIYFDWKLLSSGEKETQISVVAVQRSVLDPIVGALLHSGLKPLRFEPDASALSRLIKTQDNQYALLLEINPTGAYLTLVEKDKAVFTTVVPHGSNDSPEEYIRNINQGLHDIIVYYKDKNVLNDKNVLAVITGEMASPQWVQHVSKLLSYPAKILEARTGNHLFNKAYAAALAEIRPPQDPLSINVLSKSLQTEYEQDRKDKIRKSLLGRSATAFGFLTVFAVVSFLLTLVERQRLEKQILSEQVRAGSQGVAAQKILALNSLSQAIVSLSPLRETPIAKLEAFADSLSEGVSVTQWEFDDSRQQMRISGTARTREELLAFKSKLEDLPEFTNVALPLGTLETPVEVPFVMTFLIAK